MMAWTGIARQVHSREGLRYPSDMTDAQWRQQRCGGSGKAWRSISIGRHSLPSPSVRSRTARS